MNVNLLIWEVFRVCHSLQYNKDLANVFESVKVDLQDITLLEQAGRDNLLNFANSGIGQIDYEAYLTEVISLAETFYHRLMFCLLCIIFSSLSGASLLLLCFVVRKERKIISAVEKKHDRKGCLKTSCLVQKWLNGPNTNRIYLG